MLNNTNVPRAELIEQLRELGVHTVTADYDGYGDGGQIEDPQFGGIDVPTPTMRAVEDLFYALLEQLYSGWEIDDGSFGQFRWDVAADKIGLVHNARIQETLTEAREL
jgi:hypothetical protein